MRSRCALTVSPVLSPQCSMPACVTAFHVTCAFDHNLDMRTILADNDEVKFKSFCLEHSTGATKLPEEARTEPDQAQLDLEKVTLRKQKLQQLEEDFYELVKPSEVAENLDLSESLVDFVYQYWKLKRKANSNKPLLTPKTDEVDNLAQQEQDVLYRRLKLFTHLRQDLERVSVAFPVTANPCAPSGLLLLEGCCCAHPYTDRCAELSQEALTWPGWMWGDGSPQMLSRQRLEMNRGLRFSSANVPVPFPGYPDAVLLAFPSFLLGSFWLEAFTKSWLFKLAVTKSCMVPRLPSQRLSLAGGAVRVVFYCLSVCKYQQSLSRVQAMLSSRSIKLQRGDIAKHFDILLARGSCFPHKEISV